MLHWQIVMFVLFLLLMDADMTSDAGGIVISAILLVANICIIGVIFVDTRFEKVEPGN